MERTYDSGPEPEEFTPSPTPILDQGESEWTAGGILDQFGPDGRDSIAPSGAWYPDERFADDNGDVPSFSPEPDPPGLSDAEFEELDRLVDAWEAKHSGPDIVQDLPSWRAEHEDTDEDGDEA